jgi:hypothetical protein
MSFRFTGDLHGRPLPAGAYRIVVWQIDRKGRASARRTVTIRLARARR